MAAVATTNGAVVVGAMVAVAVMEVVAAGIMEVVVVMEGVTAAMGEVEEEEEEEAAEEEGEEVVEVRRDGRGAKGVVSRGVGGGGGVDPHV